MEHLKLSDFKKVIKTDKFVLGKEYALILDPDRIMDSRIGYHRAFDFTDNDSAVIKCNSPEFDSNEYGDSDVICKQTYDMIHQNGCNIVYFKFVPKNEFISNPFGSTVVDNTIVDEGVENSVYENNSIRLPATVNIITDDINNAFTL